MKNGDSSTRSLLVLSTLGLIRPGFMKKEIYKERKKLNKYKIWNV